VLMCVWCGGGCNTA